MMSFASRASSAVIVLVSLVSLSWPSAGCDEGDEVRLPTAAELVGFWRNDDAGETRAFEFRAQNAYFLYNYPTDDTPAVSQLGTYAIQEGHLVMNVAEANDESLKGKSFANEIIDFDGTKLVLESTTSASGLRTFTKVGSL